MSFFAELKRRNVVRVGVAYALIGWALAQVAEFAVDNFGAPDWTLKIFVVFLFLGLPLALFFAWAFEITPDGVKRERDVDRSLSITAKTGRKLDFTIIAVLVVAVGFLLIDKFYFEPALQSDEVVATAGKQSIAVLPFVNMSDDKDYFADGLSEELLNLLAKIPDLKVAGRTSSFAFKGKNDDLRAIGDALGVSTVLEGSVRRSGDRLRVTAQLIKVDDGFHLWSETYDRQMADVFDIQDDVASEITDALKLHLSPSSDRLTDNMEAYSLYLEVLGTLESSFEAWTENIARLDQAIALDPGFAKAYELKAMTYWLNGTGDNTKMQGLVYEAAGRAVELDPTLIVASSFRVSASPVGWSWLNEIEALEVAAKAAPNDTRVLAALAHDLAVTGYYQESMQIGRRMIELEPLIEEGYWRVANALSATGQRDEARSYWDQAAARSDYPFAYTDLLDRLVAGEDESAIAGFEDFYAAYGWDPADVRPLVEGARNPETGKAFVIEQVNKQKAAARNVLEINIAQAWYLAFGYLDEYWREIDEMYAQTESAWNNADTLDHDCGIFPASGCMRHPKFIPHSEQNGMTELWDRRGPPDRCNKDSGQWVCE